MMTLTNNSKPQANNLYWLLIAVFIVLFDQSMKWFVVRHFAFLETYSLTPFLNVELKSNTGAAYNFLHDAGGWQRWLFCSIAIGMSVIIVRWLYQLPPRYYWTAGALSLILGGAVGNLWDRIRLGYVIDFIDFYVKNWHFATFNIADAAISVGAALLIIITLFSSSKENQT